MGHLRLHKIKTFAERIFQRIWWYYFFVALGFSFILVFPVFRYLIAQPSRHPKAYWLRHKLAKYFLILNGVRIKVNGSDQLSKHRPFILCSNHLSDIDILVLLSVFPEPYAFMGKYELGEYPLFGPFFKTLDIAVDRDNPKRASASYKNALQRLEKGQSIVIFPEGGIKDSSKALKPFKPGAFIMAVKKQIPIQPVTIQESGKVIHPYVAKGRPGRITVKIHEPVIVHGKSSDNLQKAVFNQINKGLD